MEKNLEKITDAYIRLVLTREEKPKLPKTVEALCRNKILYPITEDDYEILKPFFNGAHEETFVMGNVTIKHNDRVTDVAHIVFGNKGYLAYDSRTKRQIENDRIYRILQSLLVMGIDISEIYEENHG